MVQAIDAARSKTAASVVILAAAAGISPSSYRRFKQRMRRGHDPVKKPGPKKVATFDIQRISQRVLLLRHGKKRTAGTTCLYRQSSDGISRAEFSCLVRQVRTAVNRQKAGALCQVRWLRPDLVWALDGLRCKAFHVQNLQDLCSRYKFAPLTTGQMPCGVQVAEHLDHHLKRFGPPLFIKRDNGGNLNCGVSLGMQKCTKNRNEKCTTRP